MIYVGATVVLLFFIFTLYDKYDNTFCMIYVVLYFIMIAYGLIKMLYAMLNKK